MAEPQQSLQNHARIIPAYHYVVFGAFTINLAPNVTSWRIPATLMVRGGEFQIGIHTIAENGNIVVVEQTFTTEE